jgi:hypothetical protein
LEDGEITDKGYLNQANCRSNRAEEAAALYAPLPDARVISL